MSGERPDWAAIGFKGSETYHFLSGQGDLVRIEAWTGRGGTDDTPWVVRAPISPTAPKGWLWLGPMGEASCGVPTEADAWEVCAALVLPAAGVLTPTEGQT